MKGQLDFILGAVTGTNNVNILDDLGIPSTMVKIPKFKISDVISGGPSTTHPMFIIDGVEKDAIYVGKYESIVSNSRAYSLPGRVPYNKASFSQMVEYCRNKGEGWHAMTNAEYAGLSLWSRANGTLPRGNDYNGRSNKKTFERGKCLNFDTYSSDSTDVSNSDHYAGEQIKLDWTGDLQEVDLTGISSFKLDSYSAGSVDGSITSTCASGVVTVPSDATKMTANIKRRMDKMHTVPTVVLPKGTSTYSSANAGAASVIKRGDNDYYAIFCGNDGTTQRLLYATSTDGITWGTPLKLFGTDILTSTNVGTYIVPSLLKDSYGTYRLWFVREGSLYYTESSDNCVTWKVPTTLKFTHPYSPLVQVNVIQDTDLSFKLYFGGYIGGVLSKISMSTSKDGTTLADATTVVTYGGSIYETYAIWSPVIYKENGMYILFYYAMSDAKNGRVMYRLSGDGVHWRPGEIFMHTMNFSGDANGITFRGFMKDGNNYVAYYSGSTLDGSMQLCRATLNSLPHVYDNTYSLDNGNEISLSNDHMLTDADAMYQPCAMLYENGAYKAWGTGANGYDDMGNLLCYTSTDGIHYTAKSALTLTGVNANPSYMLPGTVINDNGTYKMWYTETYNDSSSNRKCNVIYSESTDGITWSNGILAFNESIITNVSGTNLFLYFITVAKGPDGKYRALLDVNDVDGTRAIYYTDSSDGKTWTTAVRTLSKSSNTGYTNIGGYAAPNILYAGGKYRMSFIGNSGGAWSVYYAESSDGKNWSNITLIQKCNNRSYNNSPGGIWNPVFYFDGTNYFLRMINARLGVAGSYVFMNSILTSKDCVTWSDPITTDLIMTNRSFFPGLTARNGTATITVLTTTKAKTFVAGEKLRFNCVGAPIKLNTNNATKIKIECYGASGGDGVQGTATASGGAGGYAYGEFSTTKATDLYLYVGGRGGLSKELPNIGYNGGGQIYNPTAASYLHCGGGASDVRNVLGDISRRIIVAGGGGNADIANVAVAAGGLGGGTTGGSGASDVTGYTTTGGTQSSHGTYDSNTISQYVATDFTPDQSYGTCLNIGNLSTILPDGFAPGGGGFYGGGSSAGAGGGGGSSYISGNVNCSYLHPDSLTLTNSGTSSGLNTQKDGYIILTILETTDTKRYSVGDKVRFNYTGAPQTFIQGNATQVQVECFGASGGYIDQESKGGYAIGTLPLAKVDILSVMVGGMGKAGTLGAKGIGGYNGGGDGGSPLSDVYYGGSGGGGATDVRSVLTDNIFSSESLTSRLVVAGGGGGQSSTSTPGDGGGWSGTGATALSVDGSSLPGSQKVGYSLGQGGDGDDATVMNDGSNEGNGGGGGGYYGGYGGIKLNNGINNDISGAGGSSYVAGDTNCPTAHSNGITLTSTSTTGSANTGNGYVIITITAVSTDRKYISGEKYTFNNINDVQTFSTKNAKRIKIECFGAEGAKGDETCGEPGLGGYVSGDMILNSQQTLQLYVGGKGGYNTGAIGGFNGGGQVTSNIDNKVYYGSGATDVRTVAGNLNSRLIVAGAGGSSAKSINKGTWSSPQMAIDVGNPEKGYRSAGNQRSCVIKDGSTYKMWFEAQDGYYWRIYYSTSTDGTTWTNPILALNKGVDSNSYGTRDSSGPCVIKDGDTYKMWHTAFNGTNWRIMYTTSTDGIVWAIPVLSMDKATSSAGYNSQGSAIPNVMKNTDGTYTMWFDGFDSTNWRILRSTSPNGINWSAPTLVLNIGTNASGYNSTGCTGASVTKMSDGTYKMWVSGNNGTNVRVLYSTSTDGITWTAPLLAMNIGTNAKGYNSTNSCQPYVLNDNGTYKMWFCGYNGTNYRILYATSTDASTWTVPVLVLDKGPAAGGYNATGYTHKSVINDNGLYKMWAGMNDGAHLRIGYFTSVDAITWTSPLMVMDIGTAPNNYNSIQSCTPFVIKDGNTYKMWFAGNDGTNYRILYSTSTDGIIWTTPVLTMNIGTCSYNSTGNAIPSVIKTSTGYKMWFAGYNGTNWRILYSTSSDGVTWSTPTLSMDIGTSASGYNSIQSNAPSVMLDGTTYKMWFVGYNGTNMRSLYSTSSDGNTWSAPILALDKGTNANGYNSLNSDGPFVMKDGSTYRMWLDGSNGTNERILYSTSSDGTTWAAPTLALDIGTAYGTYNTGYSYNPSVIKDGSIYKCWFAAYNGTNMRTMYSTSADGIIWSLPILVLDIGTNASGYNSLKNGHISLLKVNGVYKMWFDGNNGTADRILYSTSTDGITWTAPVLVMNIGTCTYNTSHSTNPAVILDGSTYKMWFSGNDGTVYRTLYSTSTDGTTWSTPVVVLSRGGNGSGYDSLLISNSTVIKDGSIYKMFLSGGDSTGLGRLLYSTSTDGTTWTPTTLLFPTKRNTYESTGVGCPTVIKDGNLYKIWFSPYDGSNFRILYSTLPVDQSITPVDGYDGGDFTDSALIEAGTAWDTPTLAVGIGQSSYNSVNSGTPNIIKDGMLYKMWFTGADASNNRILYMYSSDGVTWTQPQLVLNVLAGSYYSKTAYAPCVIKDGTVYKMWFCGSDGTTSRILYTTSNDGISWATPMLVVNVSSDNNNYGGAGVDGPCVIKDGSTFKMWLFGSDGTNMRILYTTSTDGINWTKTTLAMDKGTSSRGYNSLHSISPSVLKVGSVYKMWFAGHDGTNYRLLYSTSTDGINWNEPILSIDNTGTYDSNAAFYPSVIIVGDMYRIWYGGKDSSGTSRILSSVSRPYNTQSVGTTLPYTISDATNYGTGTKTAQKGVGATYQALGQQYDTYLSSIYSTLFSPGAGGWFGGLSYNGPGMGGNSYIAGNLNCPKKHPDGIVLFNTVCKPGINSGDGKIIITILETEDDFKYQIGDKIWFKYTGAPEAFTTKNATKFRMELWGAQDFAVSTDNRTVSNRGGYVFGDYDVLINKITTLYAVIGQAGTVGTFTTVGNGGYNGGGNGGKSYGTYGCGDGGGGATDIRTNNNATLTDSDALLSRLIVAGGAGGYAGSGNGYMYGGCGGDWIGTAGRVIGTDGKDGTPGTNGSGGTPGSQTTGYALGQGGVGDSSTVTNACDAEGQGGGGGGYYGGTGGKKLTTGTYSDAGGAGGSSYAVGNSNCPDAQSDGIILTNTGTIANSNYLDNCNGLAIFTILSTDDSVYDIDNKLIYTGTGPSKWSHNGFNTGVFDLVGNLHTLCTGIRVNGATKEVQIIPNNNAAKPNIDFTDESNWFALASDGSATTKGNGSKYTNGIAGTISFLYSAMAMDSSSYIHKALGLVPAESGYDYESAYFAFQNLNSNTMMNACYRGGGVGDASTQNSMFSALFKQVGNEDLDSNRGFRVCYYEP